jgi:hypothetical protein
MRTDGFVNVAIKGTDSDRRRWREEARSLDMKLADYLRKKLDNSLFAEHDRQNGQTARQAER